MENIGYYNGKIDLIENMTIPMDDRACWFGDGVYDVTMARERTPYLMDYHLDRFFSSAALLRIEMPVTRTELTAITADLLDKVDSPDVMIYWQVTRGTAPRAHKFPKDTKANLWITMRPAKIADKGNEIKLITYKDTRYLHCNIKSLNLIPNCMAEQAAKDADCSTAVFVRDGFVTECAHSNVHIIKSGKLITHPADNLILPGIVRKRMLELCHVAGIAVEERPFTVAELMAADEVFTSSTTAPCNRVIEIDSTAVGGKDSVTLGKISDMLYDDYRLKH